MNTYIFKYEICASHTFYLPLPEGAEILDVQMQDDKPVLWAMVNPQRPTIHQAFRLVVTGQSVGPETKRENYVGTFQDRGFVGHLFKVYSHDSL